MFRQSKKDAAFFDAFLEHAKKSLEAAELLVEMMKRLPCEEGVLAYAPDTQSRSKPAEFETVVKLSKAIKEKETEGDTITHETMKRLHETWITPLDRYDIHELMSHMDDVLDEIEASADRLILFEIRCVPPEARELADTVVRSCEALVTAMSLIRDMKNSKEILALCVEVNRLENVADQSYRKGLASMLRAGNDPLAALRWRDLYETLEAAADRCEDVANVIEGVVLEYA